MTNLEKILLEYHDIKNRIITEYNEKIDVMNQEAEDVRSYGELFLRHFLNQEIKSFISKVYNQAYEAGRQEAIEEAIQCAKSVKAITPTVEPPPNRLSQNQIFVGGQINMLMRVGEALSSLKDKSK